ncbi:uncharacterized protein ACLA_011810 [Aspergillus clavatus NRRL 1]|uniref:Putative zinc-finger domain-containing protein n=1 Tax=Aspergillus clavatus (strain ATCC 1007 / CBS 513.65 / DSM 816 / NCTC 3887 / NRRL 1 / QM 1276 / 107) TaxID=344612 RepID=A1CAI6_ASPCL|nr:uncharacterized protein ACLA_011810 [Aspergillus clavatus NRRL 1]EAW12754.1 hypothetical protein ACLA_011810 [Aspergillus clavatus NRRL 1]
MPIHAANLHGLSRPTSGDPSSQTNSVSLHAAEFGAATTQERLQDLDREEGELTDMEGSVSAKQKPTGRTDRGSRISALQPGNTATTSEAQPASADKKLISGPTVQDRNTSISDLEEGEASSTETSVSSRESGSPYNPPISVAAVPSPPHRETAHGPSPPKKTSSPSFKNQKISRDSRKSPAQLRIQAQGALLSLAPHNIRYSELVGEGINPTVLKQLYEEVGIRVLTPQPDDVVSASKPSSKPVGLEGIIPVAEDDSSSSDKLEGQGAPKSQDDTRQQSAVPVAVTETISIPVVTSLSTSAAKPLERKEVIARMLAAKAAKASVTSSTPRSESMKEVSPSESPTSTPVEKAAAVSSERETPTLEKEVRVREKNKAQTELARQRIEQLRKQGLMRSQQKIQSDPIPLEEPRSSNGASPTPVSQASNAPQIQHPLPDRPPEPDTSASSRIPGLFMTESEPPVARVRGLVVDSTPQPHVNQRKRPRASDFDEPTLMPKRPQNSSEDRLIIDISDDEFYGDDEIDDMDIDPSGNTPGEVDSTGPEGSVRAFPASIDFIPQRPVTSNQTISMSATPQSIRNHDQVDLRKRDLEIQAMHRRIAELEQRKKAKLVASRTESPRPSDLVVPSPGANSAPTDHETRHINTAPAEPVAAKVPPQVAIVQAASEAISAVPASDFDIPTHLPPGSTARIAAIVDTKDLEEMRSKLLRKKEIESGIPVLDAEIRNYEARLADFNKEVELLIHDIARGKEGRQQLLEELRSLDNELKGLTLEELQVAQHKLESQENVQTLDEASIRRQSPGDEYTPSLPDASVAEAQSQIEPRSVSASLGVQKAPLGDAPLSSDVSMDAGESPAAMEIENGMSSASSSDSQGSSMDESISANDESGSAADGEESMECETPELEPIAVPAPDSGPPIDQKTLSNESTVNLVLPEPISTPLTPTQGEMAPDGVIEEVGPLENHASRESSVSEAYEPPEPEADKSDIDSAYTPRFSPVSPGPMESKEISQDSETDLPLIGTVQELDAQPAAITHENGTLDNKSQPENTTPRFTPYQSPLRYFKAYRYHPRFTENVPGGFRSLTYSHNIDSMKYLCPYEATGGVCNDRSCEFQHIRDMTLSDDKILVQMGSLREGKTPEEKDQYIAGLKQIINEMRRDKVKDFNTVATEIAAYRRRFLQDPSRVLPL